MSKSEPKKNSVLIALGDFRHVGDFGRLISMSEIRVRSEAVYDP